MARAAISWSRCRTYFSKSVTPGSKLRTKDRDPVTVFVDKLLQRPAQIHWVHVSKV